MCFIEREDLRVTAAIQELVPSEILSTKQKNGFKNPPILACEDCDYKGRGDHQCVTSAESTGEESMRSYTELAELHNLVLREVVIGEGGEVSMFEDETFKLCSVCGGWHHSGRISGDQVGESPRIQPQLPATGEALYEVLKASCAKVDEEGR